MLPESKASASEPLLSTGMPYFPSAPGIGSTVAPVECLTTKRAAVGRVQLEPEGHCGHSGRFRIVRPAINALRPLVALHPNARSGREVLSGRTA